MNDVSRNTLELFIEKADKLAKYVRENHALTSIVVNPGGLMGVYRNSDVEEWQIASTLDGFLVTFRMFIHKRDRIALYRLDRDKQGQPIRPELLDLPGMSDNWYEKVKQAYNWIDTALAIAPPNLMYNDEPITRWKILETFVYGEYAHADPTHRETLNQWRRDTDLFGKLQFEFVTILGFMFGQILEVAEACKHELSFNA